MIVEQEYAKITVETEQYTIEGRGTFSFGHIDTFDFGTEYTFEGKFLTPAVMTVKNNGFDVYAVVPIKKVTVDELSTARERCGAPSDATFEINDNKVTFAWKK